MHFRSWVETKCRDIYITVFMPFVPFVKYRRNFVRVYIENLRAKVLQG